MYKTLKVNMCSGFIQKVERREEYILQFYNKCYIFFLSKQYIASRHK